MAQSPNSHEQWGAGPPKGGVVSSDLYRLLVESVRDYAIFALDPRGYIRTWNPGAQRFKGYTADEIIGKHFSIFYPRADIERGKPQWELEVAAEEGRFEDEGWRLRKDGSRFWANVVITALFDQDRLVGYAKVTRDLTERRAAELRAVEDARRVAEIESANRAKAEFLTSLSHELRTPLNAIGGYVDLLTLGIRGPINQEQRQDLERIRSSQRHLLGLINDLLNFSRIEAGQISYQIEDVSILQMIEHVLPMVGPQATLKNLTLEVLNPDPELSARVDRTKIEQVLLNLLSNAVKFTPDAGTIAIEAGSRDTEAFVTVRDTGVGIPEDKLEAIFEPFVQLGRTLTSAHEGTGLGLAISRDLARGMGGDLAVRSQVGVGSAFTLTMPLNRP